MNQHPHRNRKLKLYRNPPRNPHYSRSQSHHLSLSRNRRPNPRRNPNLFRTPLRNRMSN